MEATLRAEIARIEERLERTKLETQMREMRSALTAQLQQGAMAQQLAVLQREVAEMKSQRPHLGSLPISSPARTDANAKYGTQQEVQVAQQVAQKSPQPRMVASAPQAKVSSVPSAAEEACLPLPAESKPAQDQDQPRPGAAALARRARTRGSLLLESASKSAGPASPVPLPEGSTKHVFLSHCQRTGGDQANALYLELERM